MKTENVVKQKTFDFSVRIVNLYKYLSEEKKEYTLSKQILRSGTSIGANIEEASGGESKKDFLHKISIAYKEARETHYWLRLLEATDYIDSQQFDSLMSDLLEILRIISSIQKTTKVTL